MPATGKISEVVIIEKTTIPDGIYDGLWCGYQITVNLPSGSHYQMKTQNGVRGFVNGKIKVVGGAITWSNDEMRGCLPEAKTTTENE